jgi:alkylation response protein AidB-like acyl-CoA dehydrogenase
MDFTLSEDHQAISDAAYKFATERIAPQISDLERAGTFPRELAREMGELGFMGCAFPEQYGGSEVGFLALALTIEQIARVWQPICGLFNQCGMTVPYTILNWGTGEQRDTFINRLITAEMIGSFGLTEPDGGSDVVGAMRTRADRVRGGWVLNGTKVFNSYAPVADVHLIFAKSDPEAGSRGITAFLVEHPSKGLTRSDIRHSMLGHNSPTGIVSLQDVFVPDERVLGEPHGGLRVALNALDYGRLTVPARCLGIAQGCVDESLRYAKDRRAFGRPIGEFQLIQGLIADMVVETDSIRWMTYHSAWLKDQGRAGTRASARSKYLAAETAVRVATRAFEIFGGYAVTDEYRVGKMLTWAHLYRTGEGSANILRQLIAEDALGYKDAERHNIAQRFTLRNIP